MKYEFNTIKEFISNNPLLVHTKMSMEDRHIIFRKLEHLMNLWQINVASQRKIFNCVGDLFFIIFRQGAIDKEFNFMVSKYLNNAYLLFEFYIWRDDENEIQRIKANIDLVNALKSPEEIRNRYKEYMQKGAPPKINTFSEDIEYICIRMNSNAELLYQFEDNAEGKRVSIIIQVTADC